MGFRLAYVSCSFATHPAMPVRWMMSIGFSVGRLWGLGGLIFCVLSLRVQRCLYMGLRV